MEKKLPKRLKILYLSLERNIDLERYHDVRYLDFNLILEKGYDGTKTYILEFEPDLVIEREFADCKSLYDDLVIWIKANTRALTAIWMIDSHWLLSRHKQLAKIYDYCFVAISRYIPDIKAINPRTYHLPLCYPNSTKCIKRNKEIVRDNDIVFVGRFGDDKPYYHKRNTTIQWIKEKYGDRFLAVEDYINMEQLFRNSFVGINHSLAGEINFRVFEIMANGIELLTDKVDDFVHIEGIDKKMTTFVPENKKSLLSKLDSILEAKIEKEVIKNQIWVQRKHCLIHRHLAMLEMIYKARQVTF
jgi:hypothetical protein